jgi:precorrin-2 dehydrogenase / sirohydrochlorin ferrochelatase
VSPVVPLGLHLSGKKCVVIGGGVVAARRVRALIEGEADVLVVAPEMNEEILSLSNRDRLSLAVQPYSSALIEGAFLVVAAASDPKVNSQVAADAAASGCLLNDADEPERGDCIFPAVVRRGELVISITTGGASPSLAAQIREEFEEQFGPEYSEYVSLLSEVRSRALKTIPDDRERKRALNALASDKDILDLIRDGRVDEARAKAHACISSSQD